MSCSRKILAFALLLWSLTIASLTVYAQNQIKKAVKKTNHKPTFGIQAGKEVTFTTPSLLSTRHTKAQYNNSKSLVLRQPLNQHFKVEAGLNIGLTNKASGPDKLNKITLPVNLQYHFLPDKYRIHPYCGAGVQCKLFSNETILSSSINTEGQQDHYNKLSDTKYITILFTQGVTFEVNTKIQVSQSLHFIPGNTSKVIGIDFGVGYKFP